MALAALGEYAGLAVPTRLIMGERTRRPTQAVIEVLSGVLRLIAEHIDAWAWPTGPAPPDIVS